MPRAASTTSDELKKKAAPRKRATAKKTAAKTTTKTASRTSTKKPARTTKKPTTAKAAAAPRKRVTKRAKATRTPAAKATPKPEPALEVETLHETEPVVSPEILAYDNHTADMTARTNRKAPTAFARSAADRKSRQTQYIVMGLLIVVGIGASAAVALSDPTANQIDVAKTIEERNKRMANMVDVTGPTVVADSSNLKPDGGFIGVRPVDPATVAKPAPAATTTSATSTASTTAASASSTPETAESDQPVSPTDSSEPTETATDTAAASTSPDTVTPN